MKWVLIAALVLVLLVAVLFIAGSLLPREHSATCRAHFRAGADAIFALLNDFEGYPRWREVKSVRRLEPIGGKTAFLEETKMGPCTYVIELSEPGKKLVLRIADDSLPYGGTWTFALAPENGGTTLSITEDGFVKPALFRFLARFVFGYHSTMEQYLRALATQLGETVTLERVG